MKSAYFGFVILSFLMIFTTGFADGALPAGFRTMAGQEGDYCMYQERNSWIKEFVGAGGCLKVDYRVDNDCGRYSEKYRNENGMSKCERPVTPEPQQPPQQPPQPRDSDRDGIPDSLDRCMNNPETFNGYQDSDGCPDTPPSSPTRTQSDNWIGPIVGIIIASIIVGIIIAIVKKKKPKEIAESIIIHYACPVCSAKLSEPNLESKQNCENCGWSS